MTPTVFSSCYLLLKNGLYDRLSITPQEHGRASCETTRKVIFHANLSSFHHLERGLPAFETHATIRLAAGLVVSSHVINSRSTTHFATTRDVNMHRPAMLSAYIAC